MTPNLKKHVIREFNRHAFVPLVIWGVSHIATPNGERGIAHVLFLPLSGELVGIFSFLRIFIYLINYS